jgi:hypothetical protein
VSARRDSVAMVVRSHRKLVLLSCLGFAFLLGAWHRSQWTTMNVYERLTHVKGAGKYSIQYGNENGAGRKWFDGLSIPKVMNSELAAGGTGTVDSQEPLERENFPSTPWWVTVPSKSNSNASRPQDAPSWPKDLKRYMSGMLKWDRPNWEGHWPPFADYVDKEYDPNRWEQFEL